MVILESSRELSTGTSEACCLAAAESEPIAYRVASYSTGLGFLNSLEAYLASGVGEPHVRFRAG